MKSTRTARKHPRRSAAWRLDPYGVEGTTITLEEWRRINGVKPRRTSRRPARRRAAGSAAA